MADTPDTTPFAFDPTAFMSGQIGSKVWLCEKLEPVIRRHFDRHVVVWLLAGWYGMTSFLLQTRRHASIAMVQSIDSDPDATRGALILNEMFTFEGRFNAYTADVNHLDYSAADVPPDVVINTSIEHIESQDWFSAIPDGTLCVLQSNNMQHDDHVHLYRNADELAAKFPLTNTHYLGAKSFHYPTWGFTRFMHIGVK